MLPRDEQRADITEWLECRERQLGQRKRALLYAVGDWRHEMPQIAILRRVSSPAENEQELQNCALSGLDGHQIFWR